MRFNYYPELAERVEDLIKTRDYSEKYAQKRREVLKEIDLEICNAHKQGYEAGVGRTNDVIAELHALRLKIPLPLR